jgi:hypothetical protein
VFLCYIDESGTPEVPGTSSHFVLAGIAIPASKWKAADTNVSAVLARYGLVDEEFHTAWLLRAYFEQNRIPDFEKLTYAQRRSAVERERTKQLLKLQKSNTKAYRQAKKNYRHTNAYIHLTFAERTALSRDVADCVAKWDFARLFAELIDKTHFDGAKTRRSIAEQALENVVSRFDYFLTHTHGELGVLVHDNNQTVALKHTQLVREFHKDGTLWHDATNIIDTPFFVDSGLTRMVQIADLCAYALRRYVENKEDDLFNRIYARADRMRGTVVGVRHFTEMSCACEICKTHKRF